MSIMITGASGFIGRHLEPALPKREGRYLIHLAACNDIRNRFNPDVIETNIVLTKALFNCPWDRIVFASSTSAFELSNPYALSKMYGEHLCALHKNALALRLFNVYGPRARRGIVKTLIEAAETGAEVQIQSGGQVRDFIYVDDVCELFLQHLDEPTGIIDIGTGVGTRIDALVEIISGLMGVRIKTRRVTFDVINQQNISVARTMPAYNYTGLVDGLRKTIEEWKSK